MAGEALGNEVPTLDRETLIALLQDPAVVLVDVLAAESYAAGHLPGALSLPLARVPGDAALVLPDKERQIVLYCAGYT
ncbi:MAG: rhodanese-like domain-containing protein [Candidatus Latescibacteria bacterium]|nr:rhodanese-like domain-containing protein [Candidatus Latescibacterota bacterium]